MLMKQRLIFATLATAMCQIKDQVEKTRQVVKAAGAQID